MKDNNEIDSNEINSNEIDTHEIDSNEIDSNEIDTHEIDSNEIDSNEINSNEIDSNEIDSNKINNHEISNKINNHEIDSNEISNEINSNEIESNEIESNEIESNEIESNSNDLILNGGAKNKNSSIHKSENINMNDMNDSIDIEYNIDYLVNDDEKLIDVEKIKIQVDTYIDNYNSETMKNYKNAFDKLYQRYSNMKYTIKTVPVKDKYNSIKIIVMKNDKKETIVTELTKPKYIYYNDFDNLYKLKNNISNERTELLYKYKILVSQINVLPEEKAKFEKDRTNFINLLEEYYIYTLYHKKINKISITNKTNLIIQQKYLNKKDNISSILSGDTYLIDNNLIENINTYNIDKLTQYNNIIIQLTGKNQKDIKKDTKLIEEIKLYLDKKEKEEVLKKIEESKKIQDSYINYIILRLPIIK